MPERPGIEVSWILEEIRRDVAAPHSLTAYARRFSMRPEALSRMFRRETGEGFAESLRRQRMGAACRLLLETQEPIPIVAEPLRLSGRKSFPGGVPAYRRDIPA